MDIRIEKSWKDVLANEFEQPYFQELVSFVRSEYQSGKIFPPGSLIFSAFDRCAFDDVNVVIVGQDPYHGENQAHGLCFSVNDGIKFPPSLQNIFKELVSDIGIEYPASGNLERWANQGVLLLNATLTVQAHKAGSHQNRGWETFTDAVLKRVSDLKEGVVFLLWGAYAQKKGAFVDRTKHMVLTAAHPSPFSAHSGFFGCKHFSQTNHYLTSKGLRAIDW